MIVLLVTLIDDRMLVGCTHANERDRQVSIYTKSERTVKKYTVANAIDSAERRLNKVRIKGICMNAVSRRDGQEKITLEELNRISDEIYVDSVYHATDSDRF